VRPFEEAAELREALRRFSRRTEDVARAHGLTTRGYTLLLMIKTGRELREQATPDELEQRLQLAKSTVAELVQRNEELGLIRRGLHPDRRGAITLALTRKGERRLADVFDALGPEREQLLGLIEASRRR
jgi:DNA-binding MarR family transcriptional regulator